MCYLISYITAAQRANLNKVQRACGLKNYYYSDTDSLIVNEEGYKNLENFEGGNILENNITKGELGKLKIEHKVTFI